MIKKPEIIERLGVIISQLENVAGELPDDEMETLQLALAYVGVKLGRLNNILCSEKIDLYDQLYPDSFTPMGCRGIPEHWAL